MRDLSAEGCRFFDRHGSLRPDTELSLKIDSMGPFIATVRWREGQYVGVKFSSPLYGPVLDHIVTKGKA